MMDQRSQRDVLPEGADSFSESASSPPSETDHRDARYLIRFFVGSNKVFVKDEGGHEKFFVITPLSQWQEFLALDAPSVYFGLAIFLTIFYGWFRHSGGIFFGALLIFLGSVYLYFREAVCAAACAVATVLYLIFGFSAAWKRHFHCFHDQVFLRGIVPACLIIIIILVIRMCSRLTDVSVLTPSSKKNNQQRDIEVATRDMISVERAS